MSNKNRRGGLGRGLGALIPTAPQATAGNGPTSVPVLDRDPATEQRQPVESGAELEPLPPDGSVAAGEGPLPVPGARFAELPITSIHANAKQPRQAFDEDALAELAHSVREFGVLQPVVVRADGEGYELVMGERRLRAATAAGLETIPAIVRSPADDAMLRDALLENIHRAQLNPLEEAAAYQQLLEEFGTTHDELAQRIGRSRPQISNTIRLLNLPVAVQRRVAAGILSAGHARALLSLEDADQQDDLATRIVAEGLSVRATEELVALARRGGLAAKPSRHAVAKRIVAPAATDLANKLSDAFDTKVRVEIGRRKGKITVEFASIDDLERIVGVMAPTLATRRDQSAGAAG
ncbi:MAG: ParB/RepB/Spo0J family partition protein, partial [Actinobacteria bacterium]|nr:ParB/RepB/Spo0J family partition protein [Actinomycetota bacterium]